MKTLHITNSWHETSGGIATFYRALIEEANRRRHYIRLVVPAEQDRIDAAGEFGRIYNLKAPAALFNRNYRMIYPSQFLPHGSKLQQILLDERPDLVEICDKYTLNYLGAVLRTRLLRKLEFRPIVVGLSCERMDDNFRSYIGSMPFARSFCSRYMRWVYFPFFDYHIANSQYTAAELRAVGTHQSGPRALWVRRMGVDLSHLSSARRSPQIRRHLLENFNVAENSVLLLYAGRLAPEKNLSLLFQLMRRLAARAKHDIRLLVAGDGIERARWERYSFQQMPGRVAFLGYIKERNILADLYANCDIFVHPNPREPFGIAPLEAMASGLPLIAPNAGGITSYASRENAWLVPPNVESFAGAVEEAIEDKAMALQKTANAVATAQSFRWEIAASSFLELYDQMLRAWQGDAAALPAPDFSSTLAAGLRASLFHGAAGAAQSAFALLSRALAKPRLQEPAMRPPGEASRPGS